MMYHITLSFYRLYLLFSRKRKKVCGIENIPKKGPLIVISNHISGEDPWAISDLFSHRRPIHWLSKKELYSVLDQYNEYRRCKKSPFFAKLLARMTVLAVKHSKTIPVDRDNPNAQLNKLAIRKISQILKDGGIVGIFPEGSRHKQRKKMNPSFVRYATKYNATILPISVQEKQISIGGQINHKSIKLAGKPMKVALIIMEKIEHL